MTANESAKQISVLAFTVAFATYLLMVHYVAPSIFHDISLQVLVVEYVATLGLFESLFLSVLWIYDHHLFKLFNPLLNIGGEWNQILTIRGTQSVYDSVRHGRCVISSTPGRIAISGENNKLDNTPSSNWQSDVTQLDGRELVVLYHSEGPFRQGNPMRRGTMVFEIFGDPPSKLIGHWSDVIPAKNSGYIEIYRQDSEYENRLNQIKSPSQKTTIGETKNG